MAQTMQQQRAKYALDEVQKVEQNVRAGRADGKEFRSYASALPAMVRMNGLGQAMAFCLAKGGTYHTLYDIVQGWLSSGGRVYPGADGLMAALTGGDMARYRVAQAETLALLDWVKKFALAYMPKDDTENNHAAAPL